MPVPLRYNLRSLFYRKSATILTMVAVGLTVAVLIVLLSLREGFSHAVAGTGRQDNIVCLRKGSTSEGESIITREDVTRVKGLAGVAKDPTGLPLVSAELYAGINLDRLSGGPTNVSVRGVEPQSFTIRGPKVIRGESFKTGRRELVVGKALVGRIKSCDLGGRLRIGKEFWSVVGIMDSEGSAYDSEVWGDVEQLLQTFNYPAYTTVVVRAESTAAVGRPANGSSQAADGVIGLIVERIRGLDAETEAAYFARQAGALGEILQGLAFGLTLLMGLGALAGCTNTLLAAVSGRTPEIGSLLALGYRPWHIFMGFLVESLVLSALGGLLGFLITLPLNGLQTGTTNWQTFTEQAFSFRVSGTVVLAALGLVVAVGLLGGVLPAWRAARLKPVEALRRG